MQKHLMLLSMMSLLCAGSFGCSQDETPAGADQQMESTGSETPASTDTEGASPTSGEDVTAVQPDADRFKTHAAEHITYPATRAQVIEACAQSSEFTVGEKKWVSEHLPEGTYNSSDDLVKALEIK